MELLAPAGSMEALRAAVQEELRHHPNVAEYRLGGYGEGENGGTIAKFK